MLWVDGARVADAGAPDRGLEFGDGLFETIAVVAGRARLVERHLGRLASGAARLALGLPERGLLRAELAAAAECQASGLLKLIVTRGSGGGGYASPAGPARRLLYAAPPRERPASHAAEGITVRLCETRLAEQPLLAGLKHLNRLEQVLARAEWQDPAIAEGLMLDMHGRLVCGTMSNLFVVLKGELVTPSLSRAGVAGVMRAALMDAFAAAGTGVIERDLGPDELAAASEVFVSNALIGAWPVRRLAELTWPAGPWARRAQAFVAEW
jgi:4-amino-4-deoxychorismate lyase